MSARLFRNFEATALELQETTEDIFSGCVARYFNSYIWKKMELFSIKGRISSTGSITQLQGFHHNQNHRTSKNSERVTQYNVVNRL